MHHKNITLIVRKQLKKQFPNWKRLKKKEKKDITRKVLAEVVAEYDFSQPVDMPKEELLGIEQQVSAKGIFTLDKMARHIKMIESSRIINFSSYKRSALYLKDEGGCKIVCVNGHSGVLRDPTLKRSLYGH